MAKIDNGYYERTARARARNALIRNIVFVLFLGERIAKGIYYYAPHDAYALSSHAPLLVIESLLALLCVWRIVVALRRRHDPTLHPVFQDFARHGDVRALASEVEEEVVSGHAVMADGMAFTQRFLVQLGWFHGVIRLDDIAWVYRKETTRSVNLIPLGTTVELELFTYSSQHRLSPSSLSADTNVWDQLQQRASRARFGYSDENKRWWKATKAAATAAERESKRKSTA